MPNKTIPLTLRIDAKYKDVIDFLKIRRGALTSVVENALAKIKVNEDVLRSKRELDVLAKDQIRMMLTTNAYDEQELATKT